MKPPSLDKLKARVSPGDAVRFALGRRRLDGTVAKLGPKRAGVVADGDYYHVPYQLIQPLGTSEDYFPKEQGALETCRALLRQHGLRDWSAGLDESTSRAGVCDYRKKRISFSRLFLRAASEAEIRDTILHEIAHALAGFKQHHGAVWQKIARQIGCSAKRCHDIAFGAPRWIAQCPQGCFSVPRNRRSRGRVCKKCRQPIRFVPWTEGLARTLNNDEVGFND